MTIGLQSLHRHILEMERPVVRFQNDHTMNLLALAKGMDSAKDIKEWLDSKNAPPFLRQNIVKTLLETNPPEDAMVELLMQAL